MKAPSLDERLKNVMHFFCSPAGVTMSLMKECASGVKGNLIFMVQKELVKKLCENSKGRLHLIMVPVLTDKHNSLSIYERTKEGYSIPLVDAPFVIDVLTRSKQKYILGTPSDER